MSRCFSRKTIILLHSHMYLQFHKNSILCTSVTSYTWWQYIRFYSDSAIVCGDKFFLTFIAIDVMFHWHLSVSGAGQCNKDITTSRIKSLIYMSEISTLSCSLFSPSSTESYNYIYSSLPALFCRTLNWKYCTVSFWAHSLVL